MVLLVVLVSSIPVPKNLHEITDPAVPPHITSMPQPRSVVRKVLVVDGREREPFVAAQGERQREGEGGERESKTCKIIALSYILTITLSFHNSLLNFGKKVSS